MPKNNKEFQTPTFFKVVLSLPEMQEIQSPLEMLHFWSLGVLFKLATVLPALMVVLGFWQG